VCEARSLGEATEAFGMAEFDFLLRAATSTIQSESISPIFAGQTAFYSDFSRLWLLHHGWLREEDMFFHLPGLTPARQCAGDAGQLCRS